MPQKKKSPKSICRVVHQNKLFSENFMIMTLNQTRLFLYLMSVFPLGDGAQSFERVPPIEVKANALAEVFHFHCDRSDWISRMNEIVSSVRDISVCKQAGDDLAYFPLFSCVLQRSRGDTYLFYLNPMITPYLTQMLGGSFTAYEFGYALRLKSVYSVRLYDALKELAYQGVFTIPMDEFRVRMGLAVPQENGCLADVKFPTVKKLNQRVLAPAAEEINEKTDLQITYALEKGPGRGGPTVGISFSVATKETPNNSFPEYLGAKGGARLAPEADGEADAVLKKSISQEGGQTFISLADEVSILLEGSPAEGQTPLPPDVPET